MKTYLFTTEQIAREALSCGLKLSCAATDTVSVYGKILPCIKTYLHPADGPAVGADTVILKIQPEDSKAYIAEEALSGTLLEKSLIPVAQYRLGMYRRPVCFLTSSIFPASVERYDRSLDEPLLYQSSDQLYRDFLFAAQQESDSFRELALSAYYEQLYAKGACDRTGDGVYLSRKDGKILFIPPVK